MSESERLREALLDLERARLRERQRRQEQNSLQRGMTAVAGATDRAQVFAGLFAAVRGTLDFVDALVLAHDPEGGLHTAATTNPVYENRAWQPETLFLRVLRGSPAAVFDASKVPEWAEQPEVERGDVRSALHLRAGTPDQPALLVFTHDAPGAFGPRQIAIARRFVPLVSQALHKSGPERWANYEILERIGVGGMGEVLLARQRFAGGLERKVILKTILPQLAQHVPIVHQFLDEARVATTLNHPNVVSTYEIGESDGGWFIAMEYIRGVDLLQLMRAAYALRVPVPAGVIVTCIRDAARGLHHAHTCVDADGRPAHIVHRDVSPQNIMVRIDGVTKVVDFGIAQAANRLERTAPGTFKGKLSYMSPEQAEGREIDGRSDQFSLGIVLWEMCTARRLFHADTPARTLERLLREPIPGIAELAPHAPASLQAVISRMLARDPPDRFPDCAAVADALDQVVRELTYETSQAGRFVRRCVEALTELRTGDASLSGGSDDWDPTVVDTPSFDRGD